SEEDMIAASNELAARGNLNNADVDQKISSLIEPIRIRWLRERDRQPRQESQEVLARYVAVMLDTDGVQRPSMRDTVIKRLLSNFVLTLDEDIEVRDDIESRREFAGRLTISGRTVPFRIAAKDFADNGKFKEALFQAG